MNKNCRLGVIIGKTPRKCKAKKEIFYVTFGAQHWHKKPIKDEEYDWIAQRCTKCGFMEKI